MEQVHSTKALEFIPIDTMLKEIYRNVYRFVILYGLLLLLFAYCCYGVDRLRE